MKHLFFVFLLLGTFSLSAQSKFDKGLGAQIDALYTKVIPQLNFDPLTFPHYGSAFGYKLSLFWQQRWREKSLLKITSGYYQRTVYDSLGLGPLLNERKPPLYFNYLHFTASYKYEIPAQFFLGIGASANRFLSGKDILIAQHKMEWEIFVELTKRLEDWLEVSLQYRRGLSNLGRLYYFDQFTNRDGFIKHFSEAYALSIAYAF